MIFCLHPAMLSHGHRTSAAGTGWDLFATTETLISPGDRASLNTGIAIAIPTGFRDILRGRHGLAANHGINAFHTTLNSTFRGELAVLLFNHGSRAFTVRPGDRITQFDVQ